MCERGVGRSLSSGPNLQVRHFTQRGNRSRNNDMSPAISDENSAGRSSMDSAVDLPVVLIAVYPEFAESILSGLKKVELRRTPIRRPFEYLALYATTPVKSVVGVCRISSVISASPNKLWDTYGKVSGISRSTFREYFNKCNIGYALVIEQSIRCLPPIPLSSLGRGYRPPQSFTYIPYTVISSQVLSCKE